MADKKKEVVKQKPKTQNQSSGSNRFYLLLLFIFTFIIYGNTLWNDYALDDGIVITENHFVQRGVSGIADILTHDSFTGWQKNVNNDVAGGRYRPLSLVSFAIEHSVFGNNPGASHFVNVLLFALLGITIFILLNQLLIDTQTNYSYLIHLPFLTALLFIAHPVHTEVVANIKSRDEILSLLFSIVACIYFLKFIDEEKKLKNILFGSLFFFLSMLSKENAITFLIIIPLMLWFFRNEIFIKSIVPFFISLAVTASAFLFLRGTFSNSAINKEVTDLMNNPFMGMSFSQKYATIIYTFGKYLWLLILPFHLTNDYYPYQISIHEFSSIGTIISLLVCVAFLIIAIIQFSKKTIFSFSIIYFSVTLSVVSNLVFPVGTFMSERFLFMPSLAFCFVFAYIISLVPFYKFNSFPFSKTEISSKLIVAGFFKMRIIQLLLIIIIGSYSIKTIARNTFWKNNFSLFTEDINNSPNSAMAHHAVAAEYRKLGEKGKDTNTQNNFFIKAIEEDKIAIAINPNYAQAYYNIGISYLMLQKTHEAKAAFIKAISIAPKYFDAINNLGYCFIQENKLDSALLFCTTASKIDTTYFRPYGMIGNIYLKKLDIEKAFYYFQKAHTLEPNDAATTKAFKDINAIIKNSN